MAQLHPLLRKSIEIRSLDDRMSVAAQVTPAQIIREEDNHIRLLCTDETTEREEVNEQGKHFHTGNETAKTPSAAGCFARVCHRYFNSGATALAK
jgi:putative aminopeptidase FrvX